MDINQIIFDIIQKDNHLVDSLAHAQKNVDADLKTPTRLEGNKVLYNPKLLDDMGRDGTAQVLGEVTHNALLHPSRRKAITAGMKTLEPLFDVAADLATYHNITNSDKFVQPKDFNLPEGLSAEEYFTMLAKMAREKGVDLDQVINEPGPQPGQQPGQGGGQSSAQDAYSKLLEAMGVTGKQPQDHSQWGEVPMSTQQEYRNVMTNSFNRSRGDLPMGLKRLLKLLQGEPQVKWYERLRKMAGNKLASIKKRYTYKKMSRRFGLPYPGTVRLKRGILAAYLDASGSMDETELAIAVRELEGISANYGAPFKLIVGDTEVQEVINIRGKHDLKKLKPKGGGGTDVRPIIEYTDKLNVDLLVCFTDLYTVFPEQAPKYPVIWVTTTDMKAPFGEIIRITRKEDE